MNKLSHTPIFGKNDGFTLMEIMIVVAILAALAAMVIPRIGNRNNEIKSEVRQLATLTRQVRSSAKLQNATFRLVLDLGEPGSENKHQYWLEKSTNEFLLTENREENYIKSLEDKEEEEEVGTPQAFQQDKSILRGPHELPSGMFIESVELSGFEKDLRAGKIFIHFFPSGRVEEAAIHLKLEENQWTLAIHPLTGKTDIASQYVSLKDIKNQ
ncbi:MAG: prepilin-type N-terminal cleavage/methylation domain-containing protein [Bdellovibrionales bacterium]|nr:prepilin-type N-terminal cleavage/methylation domain-containing protein [Bdellovibrionales bacterium]